MGAFVKNDTQARDSFRYPFYYGSVFGVCQGLGRVIIIFCDNRAKEKELDFLGENFYGKSDFI